MSTINGKACLVNGVPVDKVFSDDKLGTNGKDGAKGEKGDPGKSNINLVKVKDV